MKPAELMRTAYHEAGHAVLASYLNTGLRRVTIVKDNNSLGHVIDGGQYSEETEELRYVAEEAFWIRMAITRYAGAEAIRRLSPKSPWKRGADNDYNEALMALEKITGDKQSLRALRTYAIRRSRYLVEHFWPEIECLALVLLKEKTLDLQKIELVLSESIQKRGGCPLQF